ncbi:MAG: hypothetical protein N2491_12320 [Negativicutes bacterium]|nr:hypothetical protein [Negativicutes bacterium]
MEAGSKGAKQAGCLYRLRQVL